MSNIKAFLAGVVLTLVIMAITCLFIAQDGGQTIGIGSDSVISVKAQEGQTVRFFITTEKQ